MADLRAQLYDIIAGKPKDFPISAVTADAFGVVRIQRGGVAVPRRQRERARCGQAYNLWIFLWTFLPKFFAGDPVERAQVRVCVL